MFLKPKPEAVFTTPVLVCHLMYFNRPSSSWCVWSVAHLCVWVGKKLTETNFPLYYHEKRLRYRCETSTRRVVYPVWGGLFINPINFCFISGPERKERGCRRGSGGREEKRQRRRTCQWKWNSKRWVFPSRPCGFCPLVTRSPRRCWRAPSPSFITRLFV